MLKVPVPTYYHTIGSSIGTYRTYLPVPTFLRYGAAGTVTYPHHQSLHTIGAGSVTILQVVTYGK
jgi:hypothetical protein